MGGGARLEEVKPALLNTPFLLFGGRQLAFSPTFARLSIPAFPMVDGGASEVRTFYLKERKA